MNKCISYILRVGGLLFLFGPVAPISTDAQVNLDSLPPGVTPAMIEEGEGIFKGAGLCAACHGPDGTGLTAPDLTDSEWVQGDGSFEAIVQQIIVGVAIADSRSGIPMLPRGGTPLTDDQVSAVAAYVWSLRFPPNPASDGGPRASRR